MIAQRYRFHPDYLPGAFANTAIDTTQNVGPYEHAAIAPYINITGTTAANGTQAIAGAPIATTVAGSWTSHSTDGLAYSAAGVASVLFTTAAQVITINLAGVLTSGMDGGPPTGIGPYLHSGLWATNELRNGGYVQIAVGPHGGALTVIATLDCSFALPTYTFTTDGTSHDVTITVLGTWNPSAVTPIGPVVAGTGTSIATNLTVGFTTSGTGGGNNRGFQVGTYTITATTSGAAGVGKFRLDFTPRGGVLATIATNLDVGTTYDSTTRARGCAVVVNGTIVLGDSATWTTDQVMAGIRGIALQTGSGGNTGTYTSPVIDSAATDTQWFTAEWTQSDWVQGHTNGVGGYVSPSFSFAVGNTPTPDGSWTTRTTTPPQLAVPSGMAILSLNALNTLPRARYGQWSITFPNGLTDVPWFRDVVVTNWVPERDPHLLGKLGFAKEWVPGPVMQAVMGVAARSLALTRALMLDTVASASIAGAVDGTLAAIGADLGTPQYSGEPPLAYRNRLQAVFAARSQGGSPTTIATVVGILVFGVPPAVAASLDPTGTYQTVSATSPMLPTGPVQCVQLPSQRFQVNIPTPQSQDNNIHYPGLPGLPLATAQAVITSLVASITPLGAQLYIAASSTPAAVNFN